MRRYKVLTATPHHKKVEPILLTATFYEQQQKKLQELLQQEIEVKDRLKTAREMGDLSENGMYKAAKFELGSIGRQLRDVNFLLQHGVVPPIVADQPEIDFGSKVTLLVNDATHVKYTIVSEYEADPSDGKISLKSPLGKILKGKKAGGKITLQLPKQHVRYEILEVR